MGSDFVMLSGAKIEITDKFVLSPGVGYIIQNAILLAGEWLVRERKPDSVHLIAAGCLPGDAGVSTRGTLLSISVGDGHRRKKLHARN